jgi:hypothetical protein
MHSFREAIEAACRKGNSSIHATGSSPGFITEALPIVLTSIAPRSDFLLIDEFANCTDGCSEEMLLKIMGSGETPGVFARRHLGDRDKVFEDSLCVVADAIGLPTESFDIATNMRIRRSLSTHRVHALRSASFIALPRTSPRVLLDDQSPQSQ